MKKFIFQTIALCIAVQSMAQALCVKQSDGTISEFALSRVDSVSSVVTAYTGFENGHEWVDLGLYSGTLWATTNLGGASANSYGDYFAWGEITTKDSYTWENYTLANGSSDAFTKYCDSSSYGTVDNKTTLEATDDAATQLWGGAWRMPTIDEWDELLDKCDWTWTTLNGVKGYKVKSTNGNSIFLPAAGCRGGDELDLAGSYGVYWSSSLDWLDPRQAQHVYFGFGNHRTSSNYRNCGRSVRPVCKK